MENQLGDCSFAILATDDSFSEDLTLRLVDLMVERRLLYQVGVALGNADNSYGRRGVGKAGEGK